MNNTDLKRKVRTLMDKHCSAEGSVRPVDVLLDLAYLKEKVCTTNLSKLKTIIDEMSAYAKGRGYKENTTVYKHKGKVLRFSKSGSPYIERKYSTHFISRSQLT